MKKIYLATLILISICSVAQKGKTFPFVNGENLQGTSVKIPESNGKITIVAMVFHRSAEDELKKWLNPLYSTFVDKPEKKQVMDMSSSYDVNFVFIPMIGGLKMIREEFKATTDKGFWPYVVDTKKSDMKQEQKLLEIADGKTPYIMVLDKNGKVLEVVSGKYDQKKMDILEEACESD